MTTGPFPRTSFTAVDWRHSSLEILVDPICAASIAAVLSTPQHFIDRMETVVLLSPPGMDKTHLVVAFRIQTIDANSSVSFLTLELLMSRPIRAR